MISIYPRELYPEEPAVYRTIIADNPTLLITWWATGCSLFIILTRCAGRYVRTMRLFRDDWWILLSIIPLVLRLSFAHIVLKYGTNNTQTDLLSDEDIRKREIGSGIVLAARVFFVVYIWVQKFCITEFYKRLTTQFWRGVYDVGLKVVRWGLLITGVAAVISVFVECQPFDHYWQVKPDPGPKCRNGAVPLLVTGSLDIFTDVILVIFPIPAIIYSKMPNKRKGQLISLFSLSLIVVGVVCGRIPATMERNYSQPFRTLMASLEILAATFASNALVLSSFLRDKGPKRPKFKSHSEVGDSRIGRSINTRTRSEAGAAYWGSDEDLVRDTGFGHEMEGGPMSSDVDRQPSDASSKPIARPVFNRHFSAYSDRTRAAAPTPTQPLSAPPIHSTSTNVRSSNWGFPLQNGLALNTNGIAVTTIETRYSPVTAEAPGQAFEMSPVAGPKGSGNNSSGSLERRTSIGGGRIVTISAGNGSSNNNTARLGTGNSAEGPVNTSINFNDVGGLLK
ncbi:hypothetical protein ABW19_dt0208149 [Dactylella cylindrospora]|nr:hypothetical protein ABW19_dt0208149 [Dactylella cylindrospora]